MDWYEKGMGELFSTFHAVLSDDMVTRNKA